MRNRNCNNKAAQVKGKPSILDSRYWMLAIVILLFIILLQAAGRFPAAGLRSDDNQLVEADNNKVISFTIAGQRVTSPSGRREDARPKAEDNISLSSETAGGWSIRDIRPQNLDNDWLDELLNNIWAVESDGRLTPPDGDAGQANGPLQIHQCVLDDVNERFKTNFNREDLCDIKTAKLIARLYITMWMDRHRQEIACRIFHYGPAGWRGKDIDGYWEKIRSDASGER